MDVQVANKVILLASAMGKAESISAPLKPHFEVRQVNTSAEVIREAANRRPDLILVDSKLEDIEGRFVVHALRQQEVTKHTHILILSKDLTPDRLMEFYSSGVDDVLSDDVNPSELIHKIDSIFTRHERVQEKHREQLSAASSATMSAITYAGELGILIEAMVNTSRSKTIKDLAENTINTCEALELSTCMQFRLENERMEFSSTGAVADLEEKLLNSGRESTQRIVTFERRLFLNSPKFTLLIRNLPTDDPDKVGRYRDHLGMLLNITEARVHDIERELAVQHEIEITIDQAMKSAEEELAQIIGLLREHRDESEKLMSDLIVNMESEMMEMCMDSVQEGKLVHVVETGRDRMAAILDSGDTIDHCISSVKNKIYTIASARE